METEYIRKDHAIDLAKGSDGEYRGTFWLVAQLEMIHPADVRPNTHSKWLRFMGGSDYQCPGCNWGTSYDIPRRFCPNCGADFIGGDADG